MIDLGWLIKYLVFHCVACPIYGITTIAAVLGDALFDWSNPDGHPEEHDNEQN